MIKVSPAWPIPILFPLQILAFACLLLLWNQEVDLRTEAFPGFVYISSNDKRSRQRERERDKDESQEEKQRKDIGCNQCTVHKGLKGMSISSKDPLQFKVSIEN